MILHSMGAMLVEESKEEMFKVNKKKSYWGAEETTTAEPHRVDHGKSTFIFCSLAPIRIAVKTR